MPIVPAAKQAIWEAEHSNPEPESEETGNEDQIQPTIIPTEAYWSAPTVNAALISEYNAKYGPAQGELSSDATMSVMTDEQKNWMDNIIMGHNQVTSRANPLYAIQTTSIHLTSSRPGQSIESYYSDRQQWMPIPGNVPLYPTQSRPIYVGGVDGSFGGGGGITALDVDYRSSFWKMPDVASEQFRLEPVLEAGFLPAIRPSDLGGIALHADRHATIRVMSIDGSRIYATTNFMLQSVNKNVEEDFTPLKSIWGTSLQFMREKFKLYRLDFQMLDAKNFDWQRAWKKAWNSYIRGSVLAANKWRFYVLYGSHLLGGYPIKYRDASSADEEPLTKMSITLFITDDESLPKMTRMESKTGLVYFQWTGTTYVSGMGVYDKPIPELDDEPPLKARESSETEVISDE